MADNRSRAADSLRSLAKLIRLGDWKVSDLEDAVNESGEALTAILNAGVDKPTERLINAVVSHLTQFTLDGRSARLRSGLDAAKLVGDEARSAADLEQSAEKFSGIRDLTPSYCSEAAHAFESLASELDSVANEPASLIATAHKSDWRARLSRAREAFLAHRAPRLAAEITAEPKSDTYHSPPDGGEWLSQRGYRQWLNTYPVRPPLDGEGWFSAISVYADGESVGTADREKTPAWRTWLRFREDAERAVRAFNDAPATVRQRYGAEAHPDADGWLALLFSAAWLTGNASKLSCDDGEPYREGDAAAWFSCVTHLADASVELIDALLAAAASSPPTAAPPNATEPAKPATPAATSVARDSTSVTDIWRETLRRSVRDFEALRSAGLAAVFTWGPTAEALEEAEGRAAMKSLTLGYKGRLEGHWKSYRQDDSKPPSGWPIGVDSAGFASVCIHAERRDDASRESLRRLLQAGERAMQAVAGAPNGVFRSLGFAERYIGSPKGDCWLALLFALAWNPVRGSDLRADKYLVHGGASWGPGLPEMLKQGLPEGPLPWFSLLPDLGAMSEAAVELLLAAAETATPKADPKASEPAPATVESGSEGGSAKNKGGRPRNPLKPLAKKAWAAFKEHTGKYAPPVEGGGFEEFIEANEEYRSLLDEHALSERQIHNLTK